MELTTGMDRSQFHDKAWALYQAKALGDAKLPKLSLYAIRTLWNALYDSMPVSTAPTTGSAPKDRYFTYTGQCGWIEVSKQEYDDSDYRKKREPDYDPAASPAASMPVSISDAQILEALEACGVQWQSERTLANDHEYMTYGSQPAKNIIAGIRALLAASAGGDRK